VSRAVSALTRSRPAVGVPLHGGISSPWLSSRPSRSPVRQRVRSAGSRGWC